MQAKIGDTVRVHYTGTLDDGEVFDSSEGRDPLQFTLGEGSVIPGFEKMVEGLEPGAEATETIPCDQAYGKRREELLLEVERSQIPADIKIEVGQRLQMTQVGGQPVPVLVVDVTETTVKLDANHPLADKDLTFTIRLEAIVDEK